MVALHLVGSLIAATDIMAFVRALLSPYIILLNWPFEIYFMSKIEQNFCDCKSVHPGWAYGNWKWSFNHKLGWWETVVESISLQLYVGENYYCDGRKHNKF